MAVVSEVLLSGSQELHVLAVDDSHVDRKVIEKLLKKSSCKVTAVESGTRALQFLGLDGEKGLWGLKVNLIMTDYSMPGMTGYELLKKIKQSSAFREVPVVIMSSENILTCIDRCLEEGAEEFLVKPVKLSDVKRLKDCIMRGGTEENRGRSVHKKRKFEEDSHPPSISSHSSPLSPPTSTAVPYAYDLATSELPSLGTPLNQLISSSSSHSPFRLIACSFIPSSVLILLIPCWAVGTPHPIQSKVRRNLKVGTLSSSPAPSVLLQFASSPAFSGFNPSSVLVPKVQTPSFFVQSKAKTLNRLIQSNLKSFL
ncbi:hypothetical protein PTKIN_Ptkin04bG0080300 [Pterospermum kingtungense]